MKFIAMFILFISYYKFANNLESKSTSETIFDFLTDFFDGELNNQNKQIAFIEKENLEINNKTNKINSTLEKFEIIDLNNPNYQLNNWMSISSEAFLNENKYPKLLSHDGKPSQIDLIKYERINENYNISKKEGAKNQNLFLGTCINI